jgi:type II secretory pathway predicted ATPase ExeA
MSELFGNPFRTAPGSDPPHLVGRDTELSVARLTLGLTASAAPATPVVITGLRGMGKTVLLRRAGLEARAGSGIVVYAEATRREPLATSLRDGLEAAARSVSSVPSRLKKTMDKVVRALPKAELELPDGIGTIALTTPPEAEAKRFTTLLRELNEQAWKHGRFVAFLIDEIQEAPLDDLLHLIRFIHESAGTNEPAILIGAGLPNARAHLHEARTYTERWRYLEIGLLDAAQAREAIAKPIRDAGHTIDRNALDALVEESAGYPFFIQEYASAAWMQHSGKKIERTDVAAIVPGVRKILETSLYDARFRTLTPRECRYVLALADLGAGAHTVHEVAESLGSVSAQVSSIRNRLVKKDVLFVPNGGMVEFRIPLSERYVREHRKELERRAMGAAKSDIRSSADTE